MSTTAAFAPHPPACTDPQRTSAVDVEALYPGLSRTVERLVARSVDAPVAVVEDACQVAWIRLIRHAGRVRAANVVGWLVHTARNEVRHELRRRRRELSLEALSERRSVGADERQSQQLDDRLQLMSVALLPERQQRIVWLQAAGLRYSEIAAITSDTPRTVERQLARGRARLRAAA